MIKSINYSQTQIIDDILTLYVPNKHIDCDCTYSKGVFYKDGIVAEPTYKFDINPINDTVEFGDSRYLPLENASISCLMFDPPFLATKGKSLNTDTGNLINRRFGVYPTEKELHSFYADSIVEAYRVLKTEGIYIFKCQDKVSNSKQYMSHIFIYNEAVKQGFYPVDLFILLAKSRLVADWQVRNQKHARKFHSYFGCLRK